MKSRYSSLTTENAVAERPDPPSAGENEHTLPNHESGSAMARYQKLQDASNISTSIAPLLHQDFWEPLARDVFKDILLVIDESDSMLLWHQLIDDLKVTFSLLKLRHKINFTLAALSEETSKKAQLEKLIAENERLLVLIVSDCVAPSWHNGTTGSDIARWGQRQLVTILQTLPRRLWSATALSAAVPASIRMESRPPLTNTQLTYNPLRCIVETDMLKDWIAVPVLALEEEALLRWSKAIRGNGATGGYVFAANPHDPLLADEEQEDDIEDLAHGEQENDVEQSLERFRATASRDARRLTSLLVAAPITLPLMRHILRTVFYKHYYKSNPDVLTDPGIIAEVLLGGLIERTASQHNSDEKNPDEVQFAFIEGVHDYLLDTLPLAHTIEALEESYDFWEERYGPCLDIDLKKLLTNTLPSAIRPLDPAWLPFIKITAKVVRRMGGSYKELADRLAHLPCTPEQSRPYLPYKTIIRRFHQDSIVARLHELLEREKGEELHTVIVEGVDGTDKQHIAAKYARYHRDSYAAIVWLRANSCQLLLKDVLEAIGLDALGSTSFSWDYMIAQLRKRLQPQEHSKPFLLIFSGLEKIISQDEAQQLIEKALVELSNGSILLLKNSDTEARLLPTVKEHVRTLNLRTYLSTIEEETRFLLERSGQLKNRTRHPSLAEEAQNICQALQAQPYFIAMARAYIRVTGCTTHEYATYHENEKQWLAQRASGEQNESLPDAMFAAYLVSMRFLAQVDPLAIRILHLCIFFHREVIYRALLEDALGILTEDLPPDTTISLHQSLELLTSLALLYRASNNETYYRIRPVTQKAQRKFMLMQQEDEKQWMKSAFDSVARLFPKTEFKHWDLRRHYIPHAEVCLQWLECKQEDGQWDASYAEIAEMLIRAGDYLTRSAYYNQAKPFYEYALKMLQCIFGDNSWQYASCLSTISEWHRLQHYYPEARKYSDEAFALYKELGLDEKPLITPVLNSKGLLCLNEAHYVEAEQLFKEILDIMKIPVDTITAEDVYKYTSGTFDEIQISRALNNLAGAYYCQERYADAKRLFLLVRERRENVLEPGDPDIATCINNLGRAHQGLKEYKEAEECFAKALELRQAFWGNRHKLPFHPEIANSYTGLGSVYHDLGEDDKALEQLNKALDIRQMVLREDHPDIATSHYLLGSVYRSMEKNDEAREQFRKSWEIRLKTLGPDHPDTLDSWKALSSISSGQAENLNKTSSVSQSEPSDADQEPVSQKNQYSQATSLNMAIDVQDAKPDIKNDYELAAA